LGCGAADSGVASGVGAAAVADSVAVLSGVEPGAGVGSRVGEGLIRGVGDATAYVVGVIEAEEPPASVGGIPVTAGSPGAAQDAQNRLKRTRIKKLLFIGKQKDLPEQERADSYLGFSISLYKIRKAFSREKSQVRKNMERIVDLFHDLSKSYCTSSSLCYAHGSNMEE
jgi:hypothetical protein